MTQQSQFVEQLRQRAHEKFEVPYKPEAAPGSSCPLLPILVAVPEPDGSGGEIVENLLWRLGDPTWEPKGVAGRICQDLNLPPDAEKDIEEQIRFALRGHAPWRDLGGEKLVRMEVYVRRDAHVFRDQLEWDVSCPANTAQGYAAQACSDLHLDLAWFDAISAYMQMRIDECVEDLKSCPEAVELLPPVQSAVRAQPLGADLPRVEPYDAAQDVEAHRLQARALKLQQRRKEGG